MNLLYPKFKAGTIGYLIGCALIGALLAGAHGIVRDQIHRPDPSASAKTRRDHSSVIFAIHAACDRFQPGHQFAFHCLQPLGLIGCLR